MKSLSKPTPLLKLLREMTAAERKTFARWAGTSVLYLYQLAAGSRQPRLKLALAITRASQRMHERTVGRTPVLGVEQLSTAR